VVALLGLFGRSEVFLQLCIVAHAVWPAIRATIVAAESRATGVGYECTAEGIPHPARRGREARPPQDRRELDLFHLQERRRARVWHPKGWALFQQLIAYMRERQNAAGYQEVNTPEIMDRELWVKSGHMETFGENMFMTQTPDERVFGHQTDELPGGTIQVFKQGLRQLSGAAVRFADSARSTAMSVGALHA